MWYEDLRPFGATETEVFDFVERVCAEGEAADFATSWLVEDQPFALLFRALYRSGFVQGEDMVEQAERAVAAAPNSPLIRLVASYILGLHQNVKGAREHLGCVDGLMTSEAVDISGRIATALDGVDAKGDAFDDEWAREFREELVLKLGRSAGLVQPWFRIDERNQRAELQFLFRLAKFRGDLKEAVAIGKRLASVGDESSLAAQELEFLEREIAFVRARSLLEEVERQKSAACDRAIAVQEEDLENSFAAVLKDLAPYMEDEAEDGEIHRTFAVVKAELASSAQKWSVLSEIAAEAQKTWPGQPLWDGYARTAQLQTLFEAFQAYEKAGDDANAWDTLELLIGLDPENPDFKGRAEKFRYVIPGGREDLIRSLFAPYVAGEMLGEGRFVNIEVGESWIKAHVLQSDGARVQLILEHISKARAGSSTVIPSFSMRFRGKSGTRGLGRELRALAAAVAHNATDDFPWVAASFSDM